MLHQKLFPQLCFFQHNLAAAVNLFQKTTSFVNLLVVGCWMDVRNTHATNHTGKNLVEKLEILSLIRGKNTSLQRKDDKEVNISAAVKTILITWCQLLSDLGAIRPIFEAEWMNECLGGSLEDVSSWNQTPVLLKAPRGNFREPDNYGAPYFIAFPFLLGCDRQHWPACCPLCTLTSLSTVEEISYITTSAAGMELKGKKCVHVAVYPCHPP